MAPSGFTLVAAVNSRKLLADNLLASPALSAGHVVEVLQEEGAPSASIAYNHALDRASHDVVVFAHQDVYLPAHWLAQLARSIEQLDSTRTPWGVLGCFGSRHDVHGGLGRVCTNGRGLHGNPITAPHRVETLDEIVLVLRRSSGLRFDPGLPHFHMYGTDICLAARRAGLQSFAIPAFCVHNTNQLLELPPEFYECYRYIKAKWRAELPIAASCMVVSRLDRELRRKKLEEFKARLFHSARRPLRRVDDPKSLLPSDFWERIEASRDASHAALATR